MSEPFDIFLSPEGDEGASLRWRNAPDESFRPLLMNQGNHGNAVKARAQIVNVVNGTMSPGGHAASLIILEFQFHTPLGLVKHRFKSAAIRLTFQDVGDGTTRTHHTRDPIVNKIAPQGDYALNPRVTTKPTTKAWYGTLNAGYQGLVGGSIAYNWDMKRDITTTHYTSLGGTPDNVREEEFGRDNAALWWLEEDGELKTGIPKWFRTAVLLERSHKGPFTVDLRVDTKVNFSADPLSLFGVTRRELNEPVTIDSNLTFGPSLRKPDEVEDPLTQMESMDLVSLVNVAFATPIETE